MDNFGATHALDLNECWTGIFVDVRISVPRKILAGDVDLFDNTLMEKRDTVRDIAREAHLVGHADHRHAFFGQQAHRIQHLAHQFRIQGRSGLVKEHVIGLHREGAGNGEALLLAAGQSTWVDV